MLPCLKCWYIKNVCLGICPVTSISMKKHLESYPVWSFQNVNFSSNEVFHFLGNTCPNELDDVHVLHVISSLKPSNSPEILQIGHVIKFVQYISKIILGPNHHLVEILFLHRLTMQFGLAMPWNTTASHPSKV